MVSTSSLRKPLLLIYSCCRKESILVFLKLLLRISSVLDGHFPKPKPIICNCEAFLRTVGIQCMILTFAQWESSLIWSQENSIKNIGHLEPPLKHAEISSPSFAMAFFLCTIYDRRTKCLQARTYDTTNQSWFLCRARCCPSDSFLSAALGMETSVVEKLA